MQNTTADYKIEINKPSRSFECKITIGNNIYTNEDLVNLTLEFTQPQEGFSIGGTISKSLDLTLLNRGDIIYSTSQIKVEIGLKIGSKIEYILMGIFNIDDIEKTDYTTKFTAYDNMIKFETPYYSNLGDKPTLKQVVNELSSKTGVEFTGSLPAYTVSKLDGFSCREVLSYVASICCGNALITRDGKFTIKTLNEVEKVIDGSNYFNYTREEVKYKIGKISCQVDENNILSKGSIGTDSMELGFENPWVTENILNDLYNKLNGLSYLGYSMKWQGDISLDPYDIITITDVKNVVRKIPILSQKITYTGGLTSEIGAKGETKNKNSFSSSGSTANKVNRAVIEQAIIKEALIEKANIKDVEAVSIRTQTLEAKTAKIEEAIVDVAHIKDLNAINANIQNLIAADATINNALINKADITELNAVKGTINVLDSKVGNIETLVNGNLSSENIQAGGITSDKLTIANGFITNAMIANLDVSKINAGNISTNKFRIVSDSGKMLIADNTIQIRDNNRVRVQIGKDASNDYNMYVWDSAGKLMFDATGLKADGIKNKIIRDDMISDNANIDGGKINISSLVTEINKDTNTSVIKSSKVQIDSLKQTLDVAFNSLKTQADSTKSLTESHSTTINVMQGQIATAINNTQIVKDGQTILLKDDYNRTVAKVDSINSTIGTHSTKINELTGSITSVDTKVNSVQRDLEGTKSTVSSHSTQISGLNSTVSTQGSSISQLKNQISLKVEATDITNAINNMNIGGTNVLRNGNFAYEFNNWAAHEILTVAGTSKALVIVNGDNVWRPLGKKILEIRGTNTTGRYGLISSSMKLIPNTKYTISGYCAGHRVGSIQVNVRDMNDSSTNIFTKDIRPVPGGATLDKWHRFELTFTTTSNSDFALNLYSVNFADNGYVWFCDVQVQQGVKATAWTPCEADTNAEITTINSTVTTTSNKVATIETNLNSITQRVSSTESTISTHTTQLGTVDNRINTAKNAAISAAATDATSKANNAQSKALADAKSYTNGQITTVNKTITDKVAEIKTTTDSITQRVSSAETKINTVTTNFNNLQVGGTNLATETNKGVTGWGWGMQTGGKTISEVTENGIRCCKLVRDSVAATGWSYISYNKIGRNKYLPNKKYTVSFEVKASVVTSFYIGLKEGNSLNPLSGDVKTGNTVANTWIKLSATITTLSTLPSSTSQVLYLNGMNSGTGVTYIFRNLKIEEGTKDSNWSPAPEDIDSSISAVDSKVTTTNNKVASIETNLNGITQRVSSTESTVSTHTTQLGTVDSRINTAKNAAISAAATDATSKANNAQSKALADAKSYTNGQITTVNKTITDKVAEIKATTDSITQRVSSTESKITTVTTTANSAKSTADNANSKIDNLKIGCTNLFKDTRDFGHKSMSAWNFCSGAHSNSSEIYRGCKVVRLYSQWAKRSQSVACEPNTEYVISAWVKGGNTTTSIGAYCEQARTVSSAWDYGTPVGTGWKRFWVVMRTQNYTSMNIRIEPNNASNCDLYMCGVMVEKGNKPSEWAPAPEDVDTAISNVQTQVTTTSNKVATIETNLNSITSRVSSTESKVTTINGNVTSLQSRVTTAESKITATAIINTISSTITGGTGSISTTQFIMDKNGLTIKNGALTIKNKLGTNVLNGDVNGNLTLTGTLITKSGNNTAIKLVNQNMFLYDWEGTTRTEPVGNVFSAKRIINGSTTSIPGFVVANHVNAYLSLGYQKSGTSYGDYILLDKNGTAGQGASFPIWVQENMIVNSTLGIRNSANGTYNRIWNANNNQLTVEINTKNIGEGLKIQTASGSVLAGITAGDAYPIYANSNFKVFGNFTVTGSKNSIQKTQNYGDRLINAYETAEYYFGDIGSGIINSDGECVVYIDDILQECINTECEYHVFTQVYNGSISRIERFNNYFIVHGKYGTEFSWELKAKRKGYENVRLDTPDIGTLEDKPVFTEEDLEVKTVEDTLLDILTFKLEDVLMEG